jgi:ubiquinone/menaquinone biosynthesis C-methylase UbiE
LFEGDIAMNSSRSFDRAAKIYDQTRLLHEPIATHGIQAILDIIGTRARVLDIGTGTGRISIPLLERGVDLIGCDLSAKMLQRLQEKFPAARIVQADASLLPFPTAHFDFVMTVHVLHLIPPWREALREFRRVLRPDGTYFNIKTWDPVGTSIRGEMRGFWRSWLKAQGVDAYLTGVQSNKESLPELQSLGAHLTEVEVIRYPLTFTLREELERFAARVYSDAWEVPVAIFETSMEELRTWVDREYGDLDQQRADEVRFVIDVARFQAK